MPAVEATENSLRSYHRIMAAVATLLLATGFFLACGGGNSTDAGDADLPDAVSGQTCPSPCDDLPTCDTNSIESCCSCIPFPTEDVARCPAELCSEHSGDGPVDFTCFQDDLWANTPIPGETKVRIIGVVDVFGSGGDTDDGVLVEVYRTNDDATLGSLVGEFMTDSAESPCAECGDADTPCAGRAAVLSTFLHEDAADAAVCSGVCSTRINASGSACRSLGFFEIDDVPTNVPLVVVTSSSEEWRPLYSYGVMFYEADAQVIALPDETAGQATIPTSFLALSITDYYQLALDSGLGRAVPEVHGAVIGEVRDCEGVRVRNAQIGIEPRPTLLAFFNGEEDSLEPEGPRRNGTNWLGTFAGLDLDPANNPVRVTAAGLVDGELRSLGWADIRVHPGSITFVVLDGTHPGIDVFDGSSELP